MHARVVESQFNDVYFMPHPDRWRDDYFEQLQLYNRINPAARHTPIEYLPDPGNEVIEQIEEIAADHRNIPLSIEAIKLLANGQWTTVRLAGQEKRPGGLLDRALTFDVDPEVEAEIRDSMDI